MLLLNEFYPDLANKKVTAKDSSIIIEKILTPDTYESLFKIKMLKLLSEREHQKLLKNVYKKVSIDNDIIRYNEVYGFYKQSLEDISFLRSYNNILLVDVKSILDNSEVYSKILEETKKSKHQIVKATVGSDDKNLFINSLVSFENYLKRTKDVDMNEIYVVIYMYVKHLLSIEKVSPSEKTIVLFDGSNNTPTQLKNLLSSQFSPSYTIFSFGVDSESKYLDRASRGFICGMCISFPESTIITTTEDKAKAYDVNNKKISIL